MPVLQRALLHVERRLGVVCQWAHNSCAGTDSDDEDFILTCESCNLKIKGNCRVSRSAPYTEWDKIQLFNFTCLIIEGIKIISIFMSYCL